MKVFAIPGALSVLALSLSALANAQTVATIDGVKVSQEQFDAYSIARTGAVATDENRTQLLDGIADLIVLANVAKRDKLDQDPQTVAALELQKIQVLAQAAATRYVEANPVDEVALKAEYDRQIGSAPKPQQFKARHILVESEEEANALIAELQGGADFAELAKKKSTGPSGPQGGDLGWFDANAMVPPFSAAVAALEDGAFSDSPVQTQFGWHVILREGNREGSLPGFEEVKDRLSERMAQQQFAKYIQDLKSEANFSLPE